VEVGKRVEAERLKWQNKILSLEEELLSVEAASRHDRDALRQGLSEGLESQLREEQDERKTSERLLKAAESAVKHLQQEAVAARADAEKAEIRVAHLEREVEYLQENTPDLEEELRQAKSELKALSKEMAMQGSDLHHLEDRAAKVLEREDDLRREARTVEEDKRVVSEALSAVESRLEHAITTTRENPRDPIRRGRSRTPRSRGFQDQDSPELRPKSRGRRRSTSGEARGGLFFSSLPTHFGLNRVCNLIGSRGRSVSPGAGNSPRQAADEVRSSMNYIEPHLTRIYFP